MLQALSQILESNIPLVVEKVKEELVTTYKQAATINVGAFEDVHMDEESL